MQDRLTQVTDWFQSPLGQSLQSRETERLRQVANRLHGPVGLQVGRVCGVNMLQVTPAVTTVIASPSKSNGVDAVHVRSSEHALPFDMGSINIAVLPHTLDFAAQPHQILREVHRVLAADGYIVIFGFNPFSLWGVWRLALKRKGQVPWCGWFYRLSRVQDWLALLDFETVSGSMIYYRPPLQTERLRRRLHFLELAGDRWWPITAAVYVLVARKREYGVPLITQRWKKKRRLAPGLANPVTKM
ncbi:MAG: class I SAM-dependent methyltransferase [Gammaproteobacteria bacterium]|nr:class I SAM-dependent methyltransferase [Gammaproteobacteria bacterium]